MITELSPSELREIFLRASDPGDARFLALACSLLLVSSVLWLIWKGKLRAEYTPIWMGVSLALVVISVRLDWLYELTRMIGAWTPSSLIFFLGEVFLAAICLNYAVRLSRACTQIKNLTQDVALIRAQLEATKSSAT